MGYFIVRSLLSFAIAAILLILLLRAHKHYRKESCKRPIQVFFPSIIALVLLVFGLLSTAPFVLDSLAVLRNAYSFKQVTVASRQALPGLLKTEAGEVYHCNPFTVEFDLGKSYNISYTPRRKYIINIAEIEKSR